MEVKSCRLSEGQQWSWTALPRCTRAVYSLCTLRASFTSEDDESESVVREEESREPGEPATRTRRTAIASSQQTAATLAHFCPSDRVNGTIEACEWVWPHSVRAVTPRRLDLSVPPNGIPHLAALMPDASDACAEKHRITRLDRARIDRLRRQIPSAQPYRLSSQRRMGFEIQLFAESIPSALICGRVYHRCLRAAAHLLKSGLFRLQGGPPRPCRLLRPPFLLRDMLQRQDLLLATGLHKPAVRSFGSGEICRQDRGSASVSPGDVGSSFDDCFSPLLHEGVFARTAGRTATGRAHVKWSMKHTTLATTKGRCVTPLAQ